MGHRVQILRQKGRKAAGRNSEKSVPQHICGTNTENLKFSRCTASQRVCGTWDTCEVLRSLRSQYPSTSIEHSGEILRSQCPQCIYWTDLALGGHLRISARRFRTRYTPEPTHHSRGAPAHRTNYLHGKKFVVGKVKQCGFKRDTNQTNKMSMTSMPGAPTPMPGFG